VGPVDTQANQDLRTLHADRLAEHHARGEGYFRLEWKLASGDRSAADSALRTLMENYANSVAYQIAEVYALRNDSNATFEWLDRAWSTRDLGIVHLLYDPFIQRYKDDPRFVAFCRKVGLPVPGEAPAGRAT
jgi:hypothetical protein